MSLRVAVCEDQEEICHYFAREIIKRFQTLFRDIQINEFLDPIKLYEQANQQHYDVFFLDIDMPKIDGIDLAVKLRAMCENAEIIFISNQIERVFQSFSVSPLRFIRKDRFIDEIDDAIAAVLQKFSSGEKIEVVQNGMHIFVEIKDIVYIESLKRIQLIHTFKEVLEVYHKIGDYEKELSGYGFIRVHKSFLVNYRFIYGISTEKIVLNDKTEIPLSRHRQQAVKSEYRKLLMKEQVGKWTVC